VRIRRVSIRGENYLCQLEVGGGGSAAQSIRQDDAAILSSPAGMFPSLPSQLQVYSAANAVVDDRFGVDPGVDDQTSAGLEAVRLALAVRGIKVVEQSRGGDL
jgi:hypothetical protein